MTEARFASSTSRRALVRRSTSGAAARSSYQPQPSSTSTPSPKSPSTRAEPHPQSAPFVTGSSRHTSPRLRPSAPGRSKRPGARTDASGTSATTSASETTPSPAASRNSACQPACCATIAASGSASPPPTPIDELMSAMAPPSRSRGSTSRMIPMPSGIAPIARPWRVRPASIGTSESVSAHTTEPTIIAPSETKSIRRFPYRSPSRPSTGVDTAPARSVEVMIHVAFAGEVSRRSGRSLMTGTSRVCMTATAIPAKASATTVTEGLRGRGAGALGGIRGRSWVWGMSGATSDPCGLKVIRYGG
ncbi:hypothetical protein GA0115252_12504 [Streptomyces sp. DfronAA-171]|nr:hypothetical protein GA0115252_12504 [Streptomyces sp. DfronAA-171]